MAVALLGVVALLGAALVAWRTEQPWVAVALVVVGVLLVGAGAHPPLQSPLAWQLPTFLWAAESVLVMALLVATPGVERWTGFAYLAAVAWHRYDVVYRLRDTGTPPATVNTSRAKRPSSARASTTSSRCCAAMASNRSYRASDAPARPSRPMAMWTAPRHAPGLQHRGGPG